MQATDEKQCGCEDKKVDKKPCDCCGKYDTSSSKSSESLESRKERLEQELKDVLEQLDK